MGEILLVVIGILIALSINNWNEKRKESIQELKILKNLGDDIKYNVLSIKSTYSSDSLIASRNRFLLKILKDNKSEYTDSLQIHFGGITRYYIFSPRKMAFEALKSEGLEIIKNDSLRSEVIKLYDENYLLNSHMIDLRKEIHINSKNLYNKKLFTLADVGRKVPVNFNALKSDIEFINSLSYITAESRNFLGHYQNMLRKTESVENIILKEIQKLTK